MHTQQWETNPLVQPLLKWAGGKRQLLAEIKKYIPSQFSTYYEPFIGGAAVLCYLQPKKAIINDFNSELVNVYNIVKTFPNELIEDLRSHHNNDDYFYKIRELDRSPTFIELSNVKKASRVLYLNKTCFNGLFRVNSKGYFNVPYGRYSNPNIVNEKAILEFSKYLNICNVKILNGDFELALEGIRKGSFVYFDPPYVPFSDSANFTSYTLDGFTLDDQVRLKNLCDKLTKVGVKFLLSNSSVPFIIDLYKEYTVEIVGASRMINSDATKRGEIKEVLVRNYEADR